MTSYPVRGVCWGVISGWRWLMHLTMMGLVVSLLSGCAIGHVWHLAVNQTKLLFHRQPVEEALQDARLSPQEKDKIRLILAVRSFAIDHLGMHDSATYTTFVHLDDPYVTYTLTVAPKDALRPYVWRYPIIGRVPYRGFFKKEYALRTRRHFQQRDYDTYLRGVRAYSTLGYFNDPILSSMLGYHEFSLINTVIHEMLHQTVWIKGNVSFNESLASFVGEKGTLAYLAHRYGRESPEYQSYLDRRADAALFRRYMHSIVRRLEALYQQGTLSREDKLRRREVIFTQAAEDFPALFPQMKTERYQRFFERRNLNNALLMSFRVYHRDTSFFEQALAQQGGDLRRMIAYFKTLSPDQIPTKFRTRS